MMSANIDRDKKFLSASDVANILDVSRSTAYRIIRRLNRDLEQAGKISSKYFHENVYL